MVVHSSDEEFDGAKRVDIGQGDPSWVVMADPEGDELCVLGKRHQRVFPCGGAVWDVVSSSALLRCVFGASLVLFGA